MPYRQCREHATRDVRRDGDDELPVRTKTRAWRSRWVTGGACARRRPPANRRGVQPPKGANIVRSSLSLSLSSVPFVPVSHLIVDAMCPVLGGGVYLWTGLWPCSWTGMTLAVGFLRTMSHRIF